MAPPFPRQTQASASRSETRDPFAEQIRLSRMHTRLVPMQSNGVGYSIDPATGDWFELPASRGFAGYGLGRALGLLLDAMRGLSALNETKTASGMPFAHGEFTPSQFRVDPLGVCRLVPLTTRHYISDDVQAPRAALAFLSPERLIGEQVGIRADVFSAGVLLWEALAGRRLTELQSVDSIVDRLMSQRLRVPPLPPQLAWATPLKAEVERALSVNEKQRFADCAEFSAAILRIAQDRVASQAEIAAFFASNFRTAPGPEPSPARPSAAPVSQQRPVARRGGTFRMLPAVPVATSTFQPSPVTSGAPRQSTLKMNVTLRMASVPLPVAKEAFPPPPPSPPRGLTPPPPSSSSPPPSSSSPSPRSLPPPLRSSRPPPLPFANTTAASSTQELESPTPVPTRVSSPEPATPSPGPATPSPEPVTPAALVARTSLPAMPPRRPSARTLTTLMVLIVCALGGGLVFAPRGEHTLKPTAPRIAQRRVSASNQEAASVRARLPFCCAEQPSARPAEGIGTPEVAKVERAVGSATPAPQTRTAPSPTRPRGKDYGI